ncbi:HTH-type transcriptional regulator SrpR [compost metagenome]
MPAGISFQAGWQRLREDLGESVSGDAPRKLSEIIMHKSERTAASEPVPLRLEQLREAFMRRLQRLLVDAVTRGELAAELDIPTIGEVFQGCIGGLLFECLQRPGDAARKISATLDTLLYLLQNPPAHFLQASREQ